MTFTVVSDNDNIIDCNKWNFNQFLNACLSRLPTCSQRAISYKYQSPNPLTLDTLLLQVSQRLGDVAISTFELRSRIAFWLDSLEQRKRLERFEISNSNLDSYTDIN